MAIGDQPIKVLHGNRQTVIFVGLHGIAVKIIADPERRRLSQSIFEALRKRLIDQCKKGSELDKLKDSGYSKSDE